MKGAFDALDKYVQITCKNKDCWWGYEWFVKSCFIE
jgi:hypothetical protein